MADKSILEFPTSESIEGDEIFYGVQASSDVKIIADDLAEYILDKYTFNQAVTNKNVISGRITSLMTIANIEDLADKTYPPGSLYWSSSSTSPALILGVGVWTRVNDAFILAAGSTYTAGSSGGETVHLLTINEIPSHAHGTTTGDASNTTSNGPNTTNTGDTDAGHTHTIPSLSATTSKNTGHTHYVNNPSYSAGDNDMMGSPYRTTYGSSSKTSFSSQAGHSHTVSIPSGSYLDKNTATHTHSLQDHTHDLSNHTHTISAQGGGLQHNNMPPYVAYYCWERIE